MGRKRAIFVPSHLFRSPSTNITGIAMRPQPQNLLRWMPVGTRPSRPGGRGRAVLVILVTGWILFGGARNGPPFATVPLEELAAQETVSRPAAQDDESESGENGEGTTGGSGPDRRDGVIEVGPEIFYMPDPEDGGRLVPVPGFSIEEWRRLYHLAEELTQNAQTPQYSLDRVNVSGRVIGRYAQLDVTVTVTTRIPESDGTVQVRVPLRLHEATLRELPTYSGPGAQFLQMEGENAGHVCWIRCEGESQHTLELRMIVPVNHDTVSSRLTLTLPAALQSEFALRVPYSEAEGRVTSEAYPTARPMRLRDADNESVEMSDVGARGLTTVSWNREPTQLIRRVTRNASTWIVARIEGPGWVRCDARVQVQSFGGPLGSFRVRLPPGLVFVDAPETGYRIRAVAEADEAEGQLLEVVPEQSDLRDLTIRLVAETPAEMGSFPPQGLQPAMFVVEGASRQRGVLDLAVNGDWVVRWANEEGVQRDDDLGEPPPPPDSITRYRIFSQPSPLTLFVASREARLEVEPSIEVTVDADEARLQAAFEYSMRGGYPKILRVAAPGWQIDDVRLNGIPIEPELDNPILTIPLSTEDSAGGTCRVDVRGTLAVSQEALDGRSPFILPLPLPPPRSGLEVLAGDVTVTTAENVRLIPRLSEAPDLIAAEGAGAVSESNAIRFRLRASAVDPRLPCDLEKLSRQIAAVNRVELELGPDRIDVYQTVEMQIRHEPAEYLSFDVPQSLLADANASFQVLLDGRPLAFDFAATPLIPDSTDPRVVARLQLREPARESLTLELRYSHPLPEAGPSESLQVAVPLVLPSGSDVTLEPLEVTRRLPDASRLRVTGVEWSEELEESGNVVRWMHAGTADSIPVEVTAAEVPAGSPTTIRRAWLQSWLTRQRRRDRAAFRLVTREAELIVQLPPAAQVNPDEIYLAIEGQELTGVVLRANGELLVPVPPELRQGREVVLELWYHFELDRSSMGGPMSLVAPTVLGAQRTDRTYWQLVVPADEHLVWVSSELAPVYRWTFASTWWTRRTEWGQRRLEHWVGASHQLPLPDATNQYVFTSFDLPASLEVTTLSRNLLILGASGAALLLGLALVHVPGLRHPGGLLAISVALLAGAWFAPQVVVLLAQAAVLGVGLVLLSQFLGWIVGRRATMPTMIPSAPSSDFAPIELRMPGVESSSHASTVTAPIPQQLPSTESQP